MAIKDNFQIHEYQKPKILTFHHKINQFQQYRSRELHIRIQELDVEISLQIKWLHTEMKLGKTAKRINAIKAELLKLQEDRKAMYQVLMIRALWVCNQTVFNQFIVK